MTGRFRDDFFLSRRGSIASVAQEVAGVLDAKGYRVFVQDYDITITANFIEKMHDGIKNARDLIVLFTEDYEASPYTRKEFTSFTADQAQSTEERRVVILRCQDVALRGLFAPSVYQDLFGIDDTEERKRRILAAAEGQSQALKPPPRPFVGVPPQIAKFTGREPELDWLEAILIGGRPAAVTQAAGRDTQIGRAAVQGMGGVGKTSLAIEYAYHFRDLYAGVWWCPAETRTGLMTSLAGLARDLGAAAADEADLEKAARAGLRNLAGQRATYLLVYDNVASPDDIKDLLPSAGARVLITSRFSDWRGYAEEVALDVLPPSEAIAFLENRSGRKDAGAGELAKVLGYLPLALDHAAAYLGRMPLSFADYAAQAASLIATRPRGVDYPLSVAATFELAIAEAVKNCSSAGPLMAYLAHCAPERIPMALAEGAVDDAAELSAALLALTEVSLVKNDPFEDGTPAVTVHRLVQAVARQKAKTDGEAPSAIARVMTRLNGIYPGDAYDNPASWPVCTQLMPHLLERCQPVTTGETSSKEQAVLLARAGGYHFARTAFASAELLLRRALEIDEKAGHGPDDPTVATRLSDLAQSLKATNCLAEAEPLMRRALAIDEASLGPDHPHVARDLSNLADLLVVTYRFVEAEPLIQRALAIDEASLGLDHPYVAIRLNNLAEVLRATKRLAEAEPMYRRALAIAEASLGQNHPQVGRALNNLAQLLNDTNRLAEAEPMYRRALAIREASFGPDHPEVASDLNNLAQLLQTTNRLAEAEPLMRRALTITEASLGPDHPKFANCLHNLAGLLHATNRLVEAEPMYRRAFAIDEASFGPNHPAIAIHLNNLAALLHATNRLAEAETLMRRQVEIFLSLMARTGHQHRHLYAAFNNYAALLVAMGRTEAEARAAIEALLRDHGLTR